MSSYLDHYEVTKRARVELLQKSYFSVQTKTFDEGDVNIEIYRQLDKAIIQVGREYKIEDVKDRTMLDMIAIAIEMKKQAKQEQV